MQRPSYILAIRELRTKEAEVVAEKTKAEQARVNALEEAAVIVAAADPVCAAEIRKAKAAPPGATAPLPAKVEEKPGKP